MIDCLNLNLLKNLQNSLFVIYTQHSDLNYIYAFVEGEPNKHKIKKCCNHQKGGECYSQTISGFDDEQHCLILD